MELLIKCEDCNSLDELNSVIHDEWFDVADIVFEPEVKSLSVCFTRRAKSLNGLRSAFTAKTAEGLELKFGNVTSNEVQDTQRIGRYPFNYIKVNKNHTTGYALEVITAIPMIFRLHVTAIEILLFRKKMQNESKSITGHGVLN